MTDPHSNRMSLPACIAPTVEAALLELRPHIGEATFVQTPSVLAASDFVLQQCRQQPQLIARLAASGDLAARYDAAALGAKVGTALAGVTEEAEFKSRLRTLRQREMLRIAWRDLAGLASLDEVLGDLSTFADACVRVAHEHVFNTLAKRHGVPKDVDGSPMALAILAMGKLGGGELNFSSDIDLIFAYAEDGETDGPSPLSHQEFFTRVGQRLIQVLHEPTADGFVFRVDMRLRPNGASGPLVLSFAAMEHYYQTHGREWERYAWIKARALTEAARPLLKLLKPFVYRKYIDYGTLDAIRDMKRLMSQELKRSEREDDIKRGRGGIREIEFIAQALQLVRGGRIAKLQTPSLKAALATLVETHDLAPAAVQALLADYTFLRRLEHRLQMMADQQTHRVPADACARARVAYAMGYADWASLDTALAEVRARVHAAFTRLFSEQEARDASPDAWHSEASADILARAGFTDPTAAAHLIHGLRAGAAYAALSAEGRARLDRLMPLLIDAAAATPAPQKALEHLALLIEAIGRRPAYFAFLLENAGARTQLAQLCATSDFIAQWLRQHPVLLDEVLNPSALAGPFTREAFARELAVRLPPDTDDLELVMDVLRQFKHGALLRIAAAELAQTLSSEAVRPALTALAEAVVDAALVHARASIAARHGRPQCDGKDIGFAVIAYGKFGSCELGYQSDFDVVFLHESCAADAMSDGERPLAVEVYFARVAQRLLHILTTRTAGGILYPVDTRLRPSGRAGLLVTHLDAFARYQREQAWAWEHQALVRARPVAGDAAVATAFGAIRGEVLTRARDPRELAGEVVAMRARMLAAQAPHEAELFDLKHDRGGLVDIEFMVQYGVLEAAAAHPNLLTDTRNIVLLERLGATGFITPTHAQTLIAAYSRYLSLEQRQKLMEHRPLVPLAEVEGWPAAVTAVWQAVFAEVQPSPRLNELEQHRSNTDVDGRS